MKRALAALTLGVISACGGDDGERTDTQSTFDGRDGGSSLDASRSPDARSPAADGGSGGQAGTAGAGGDGTGGSGGVGGGGGGSMLDCSNVGCGEAPVCGSSCDAPCGCCGCADGNVQDIGGQTHRCNGDCWELIADGGADARSGVPDAGCAPTPPAGVTSAFEICSDAVHVGQSASVSGIDCNAVCCAFGFTRCVHRAAQTDLDACTPAAPSRSGDCGDTFQSSWSSQCLCE